MYFTGDILGLLFLSTLSLRRATGVEIENTKYWTFLSTLSLRRATAFPAVEPVVWTHFYPRSPCGERIHALLAESDSNESSEHTNNGNFYPRSPCGERRMNWLRTAGVEDDISIHALLAESDLTILVLVCVSIVFLSTLSLRRATVTKLS